MMEQPRRSNNSHFFQQAQLAKKPLSSSNLHPKSSMSGHFFSNAKTNYDASSNDEFNVWSENPINHEVSIIIYFKKKNVFFLMQS